MSESVNLTTIISYLEDNFSEKKAFLSMHQYGAGPEESFIKANKDGLALLAKQLLIVIEKGKKESSGNISFDNLDFMVDGEIFFDYVELTELSKQDLNIDAVDRKFAEKIIPIGCIGLFVFLIFSLIIGIKEIFGWFF